MRRLTWRPAELVAAAAETASARTLRFRVPGWPGHLAGQHVDVRLTAEDGYTAQRSYSMAAPADGDLVELTVETVTDGEVSPYLVEELRVGDQVELRGPVGGWFVWRPESTAPVLLVGGGSGIVPLMSMIRARRQAGSRAPFRLLYSLRDPDRRYYADELRRPDPGLDVTYLYTRSAPEHVSRPARRIMLDDLAEGGWPASFEPDCYVCGPTGFVEAAADLLLALGHAPERIRTERFGPTGG
ncbi:Flavodoxin reductases (ferredoxin-NADPH reductases) family 1 [[Actinomadura] parvosata subsp. kistnae]|uniref:ferredoxin reductase n=1 Tax=[Actinomadura] parvosata TaxID=1955412 RepID=UPI0009AD87E9|nr:ferredoxin reductase [Nonomuraea sp. ATCC 55076]SPL93687.1 Flavodoxin reductases (ferredoxin-NADPH reductases) family 1 [Actinomadura parvosata subsp. kistnae]